MNRPPVPLGDSDRAKIAVAESGQPVWRDCRRLYGPVRRRIILIGRGFGRLKINRAIATRYNQLAESFLSMVHIATARYWLKFVHAV